MFRQVAKNVSLALTLTLISCTAASDNAADLNQSAKSVFHNEILKAGRSSTKFSIEFVSIPFDFNKIITTENFSEYSLVKTEIVCQFSCNYLAENIIFNLELLELDTCPTDTNYVRKGVFYAEKSENFVFFIAQYGESIFLNDRCYLAADNLLKKFPFPDFT